MDNDGWRVWWAVTEKRELLIAAVYRMVEERKGMTSFVEDKDGPTWWALERIFFHRSAEQYQLSRVQVLFKSSVVLLLQIPIHV